MLITPPSPVEVKNGCCYTFTPMIRLRAVNRDSLYLYIWGTDLLKKVMFDYQTLKTYHTFYRNFKFTSSELRKSHQHSHAVRVSLTHWRNVGLKNYTQQSHSAGTTRLSSCHEIHRILWKPEVNHHVHRSLSPVPILSQMNPIHILPSYFFMMHLSVTFPSMISSSKWPVPSGLPTKPRHAPLLSPYVLYAPPISSSLIWSP